MSKSAVKGDSTKLSEQEQETLKKVLPSLRTDSPRSKSQVDSTSYDTEDILNYRIDEDSIRARGFLKYRYNYQPPSDVKDSVLKVASEVLCNEADGVAGVTQFVFNDNNVIIGSCYLKLGRSNITVKISIILTLSEQFKHCPTNSRLMHIKSVQDLIDFYEEPVENVTSYIKLARMKTKPRNVYMMEQAHRFHPEDVEAWHGGVTAFPGTGGSVVGLRNKRLLRQFQPKSDWFDYEDQTFDYTRPDKDMPWDPEIARRMDRKLGLHPNGGNKQNNDENFMDTV
uniref:Large ribosomal subunit protein mL50 n=1 Tax=Angiostrongylus cantonensis TaxID=6313 RepID=A0A0K0CUV7_ANGCA